MMDDECRGVRQRKKQADPTCCPICGVTVRAHEMDQHYSMEMDRLNKIGVQKYRKLQSKDNIHSPTPANSSPLATTSVASSGCSSDPKESWNAYQRIKSNRSARLKLKSRKRRADDPTCPVCNERIPDDINLHVELCLRRNERRRNNGNSGGVDNDNDDNDDDDDDDISIDVEGETYEEYEWAGQTRIRASSLLEGGYTATGLHSSNSISQSNQNDEDEDLNVDGDDSQIYGEPQYSERDIILPMIDDNNKKENVYLRNLVIGITASDKNTSNQIERNDGRNGFDSALEHADGSGDDTERQPTTSRTFTRNHSVAETEIKCESTASSSRITIDLKDGSVKEVTTVIATNQQPSVTSISQSETAAAHIIEALKEKIREYEAIIKNKSKCLICMDEFRVPIVSICCWHVHCEECWLRTLGARKLCPQCNMITSPTDLRKIYM